MDTLAANMPVSTTYSYAIGPPEWINEHHRAPRPRARGLSRAHLRRVRGWA